MNMCRWRRWCAGRECKRYCTNGSVTEEVLEEISIYGCQNTI
ncbi:MAG: hypothetical protein ACLVAW_17320 [Eisenbergiella massiliensis]